MLPKYDSSKGLITKWNFEWEESQLSESAVNFEVNNTNEELRIGSGTLYSRKIANLSYLVTLL
jgi:hypothetical protein